jgi:hypothetical protein
VVHLNELKFDLFEDMCKIFSTYLGAAHISVQARLDCTSVKRTGGVIIRSHYSWHPPRRVPAALFAFLLKNCIKSNESSGPWRGQQWPLRTVSLVSGLSAREWPMHFPHRGLPILMGIVTFNDQTHDSNCYTPFHKVMAAGKLYSLNITERISHNDFITYGN